MRAESPAGDAAALVREELMRRVRDPGDGLDAVCAYALEPTGKLLRPALVVECALAVGGSAPAVLPAAVAAECGHVASLVHDDIVDDDELRRGRPSVPHRYGIATALLAGDMLFLSMIENVLACRDNGIPDGRILDAAAYLATACRDICRGEHRELDLVGTTGLDVADYVAVARDKTGAGFRAACAIGALLGGGPPELVDALADYGGNLGIAFQIHDDLLPYLSDEPTLGKAVTSDVGNRRLTLPLILAYQAAGPAGWARLDRALSGARPPEEAYADVRDLLIEADAIDRARAVARDFAAAAGRSALLLPPSPARDRLRRYAELAITRRS
jgi:geranylgeranyl pyrophosphate synthase